MKNSERSDYLAGPGNPRHEVYLILSHLLDRVFLFVLPFGGIGLVIISGYTRDVVLDKGIQELDKGIQEKEFAFISKPLSTEELLTKVREVLDK